MTAELGQQCLPVHSYQVHHARASSYSTCTGSNSLLTHDTHCFTTQPLYLRTLWHYTNAVIILLLFIYIIRQHMTHTA